MSKPCRPAVPKPVSQPARRYGTKDLAQTMALTDELPKTLEDLVRRNRDRFEVGLATGAELAAVTGDIDAVGAPRGRIDRWHVVALRDRVVGRVTLHMLGRYEDGRAWMTSDIAVLAPDRARVRTRNSLYLLGPESGGAPTQLLVLHVAFVLRWWGYEHRYDLGLLPVYY